MVGLRRGGVTVTAATSTTSVPPSASPPPASSSQPPAHHILKLGRDGRRTPTSGVVRDSRGFKPSRHPGVIHFLKQKRRSHSVQNHFSMVQTIVFSGPASVQCHTCEPGDWQDGDWRTGGCGVERGGCGLLLCQGKGDTAQS